MVNPSTFAAYSAAAHDHIYHLFLILKNLPSDEDSTKLVIEILGKADKAEKDTRTSIHRDLKDYFNWPAEDFDDFLEAQKSLWLDKEKDTHLTDIDEKHPAIVVVENRLTVNDEDRPAIVDGVHQQLNPHGFPHKNISKNKIRLYDTIENTEHLLKKYDITTSFNQLTKKNFLAIPGDDGIEEIDLIETIISLTKLNNLSQTNTVNRVASICRRHPINPVVECLSSLDHNGTGYIQQLAEHIIVETGTEHIRDKVLRMWMIMACAAADYAESTPNQEAVEKFDSVMIFVGEQGIGKTRFFKAMFPKPLRQYFNDGVMIDPLDKDSVAECLQWWVVEAGEIDGLFKKADIGRFKAFLSKSTDVFRKPYERSAREYQRRTAFVGSANEREFLKDYTGNRRYWPLLVRKLVIPTDTGLVDNAWAEAWTAYVNGVPWWPQTDLEKDLLSQVRSFQIPITNEPVEELIRSLIEQERGVFACDVVRTNDIRKVLSSDPLNINRIEKIPSITMIGKIMSQNDLGVQRAANNYKFWVIRNKEKYEKMRNVDVERYYELFGSRLQTGE